MKYVFIGDVHGKFEEVERALAMDGMKIFVGDFMDSRDHSPSHHRICLRLVLEAIEKKEARAIFGNHELSYLYPIQHRCSGYSEAGRQIMSDVADEMQRKFESHILLGDSFLVSHAGLTRQIWEGQYLDQLDPTMLDEKLKRWWKDLSSPMHWSGSKRGGRAPIGGMFWCDFRSEFQPVPGLQQVFGHTRGDRIRRIEDSYCIDCLGSNKGKFLQMDL
jgi:hypothetical protein